MSCYTLILCWISSSCIWISAKPACVEHPAALQHMFVPASQVGKGASQSLALSNRDRPTRALGIKQRFMDMSPAQIKLFLKDLHRKYTTLSKRLVEVTRRFVGTPYAVSPLGEGPQNPPDTDPLIRFDAVDCTTFVEQSMALVSSHDLDQLHQRLRHIRYQQGLVAFSKRKHFMMAQWLPLNQKAGFLKDVTQRVGGSAVVWVEKKMNRHLWAKRSRPEKWPALSPADIPDGTYRLPIIPIDKILSLVKQIPQATLVNIVRKNFANQPGRVTHQGFFIVSKRGPVFRHACKSAQARVVDEPWAQFVKRNQRYTKWPVEGFNLQQIEVPSINLKDLAR